MDVETITVLVGTTKGRASTVAEALGAILLRHGLRVEIVAMDRVDPDTVAAADAIVVCTSTFGAGGVPANAVGFLDRLRSGDVLCRGKPVGYVGLVDRSFHRTYNGGWCSFEQAFTERGAVTIGAPLLFDAADVAAPAEAAAVRQIRVAEWVEDFLAALRRSVPPSS